MKPKTKNHKLKVTFNVTVKIVSFTSRNPSAKAKKIVKNAFKELNPYIQDFIRDVNSDLSFQDEKIIVAKPKITFGHQ